MTTPSAGGTGATGGAHHHCRCPRAAEGEVVRAGCRRREAEPDRALRRVRVARRHQVAALRRPHLGIDGDRIGEGPVPGDDDGIAAGVIRFRDRDELRGRADGAVRIGDAEGHGGARRDRLRIDGVRRRTPDQLSLRR